MTIRIGPALAPTDPAERTALLRAAGLLDRDDCPPGFAGHCAVWARDRDLLVGQAALVERAPHAPRRDWLVPRGMDMGTRVAMIDMLAVRPEYRETGLEERMVRALVHIFRETPPRPAEAVIWMGEMHAPVLLSTLAGLPPVDGMLR